MPLQVVCPNPQCRKTMAIKDELAGQTLRCPACKTKLSAVSRGDAPAASKPAKDPSTIQSISSAKKSMSAAPPALPSAPSESAGWGAPTMESTTAPPALPSAPSESAGAASRTPARGGQREELPGCISHYQVTQELGRGAFGVVYKGHDPNLKRDVAIKVLNRKALHSTEAVERFLREAQVVAQMHHNHIVPVYELGEHEECHYIASRFVPGKTLADLIPDAGMGAIEAVGLVLQLLEALTYAHKMNVLHRDVKPANAIVDPKGQLHLMDFGLAGWVDQTDGRATQDGAVMGTPSYMPPEQARGDINNVRETADQYSAGVVLYELLTGHVPFEGGPTVVVLHKVINTPPPRPSEFRADLDPQLEEICLKAMAKRPEERYPSCRAFADALRTWKSVCDSSRPIVEPEVELVFPEVADIGGKRQSHRDTLSGDEAPARSIARKKNTATTALISAGPKKKKRAGKPNNKGTLLLAAAGAGLVLLLALGVLTALRISPASPVQPSKAGEKPAPLMGNNTAAQVRQAQVAWAKYLGREVEEDHEVALGVKMKFVLIPPGAFWMGSPKDENTRNPHEKNFDAEEQHEVTLTEPFYLGKYEVTQEQYVALGGKEKNRSQFKGADLPVESVSWTEADGYVRQWTQKAGNKHTFRLPTEAEWEYACRGGAFSKDSLPFSLKSGPTSSLSGGQINFNGDFPYGDGKKGKPLKQTAPVGSFPDDVNAFGLSDMHGNVAEWCVDWYGKYPAGHVINPTGPLEGAEHVIRGGSWDVRGGICRAARRISSTVSFRRNSIGLRLALVPSGS
jgi:eukaryotic-like serine/threonine-protein kinase